MPVTKVVIYRILRTPERKYRPLPRRLQFGGTRPVTPAHGSGARAGLGEALLALTRAALTGRYRSH
jgi:hypothetical protein